MSRMRLLGAVACFAMACLGSAQKPEGAVIEPAASALLAKMRSAYAAVKSAEISTTYEQVGAGTKVMMKSECSYLAPLSFRIKSTGLPGLSPSGYSLVTDGQNIHIEGLPGGGLTQPYSERKMWQDLPQLNLEVLCFWNWQRQLSTEPRGNMHTSTFHVSSDTWKSKSYTILEETAEGQHVRVRYFVDPKTYLIWRTETYDLGSKTPYLIATIEKMDLNKPIDKSLFAVDAAKK